MNASTGDIAWQVPLGITEQLPAGKQNTGRLALAGPIATAGGVLFVASTDDNRFRARRKDRRELWVTKLERRETRIQSPIAAERQATSPWSPPIAVCALP